MIISYEPLISPTSASRHNAETRARCKWHQVSAFRMHYSHVYFFVDLYKKVTNGISSFDIECFTFLRFVNGFNSQLNISTKSHSLGFIAPLKVSNYTSVQQGKYVFGVRVVCTVRVHDSCKYTNTPCLSFQNWLHYWEHGRTDLHLHHAAGLRKFLHGPDPQQLQFRHKRKSPFNHFTNAKLRKALG